MTWKGHSFSVIKSTRASQSISGSILVKDIIVSRFRIEFSWPASTFARGHAHFSLRAQSTILPIAVRSALPAPGRGT